MKKGTRKRVPTLISSHKPNSRFLVRANTQFEDEVRVSCFPHSQGRAELPLSNNPFALSGHPQMSQNGPPVGDHSVGARRGDESEEDLEFDLSMIADLDAAAFLGELQNKSDVSLPSPSLSSQETSHKTQSFPQSPVSPQSPPLIKKSIPLSGPLCSGMSSDESDREEEIKEIVEMSGVVEMGGVGCGEEGVLNCDSNVSLGSQALSDNWSSLEGECHFYSSPSSQHDPKEVILSQLREEVAELTQQISQVQKQAKERSLSQQAGSTEEQNANSQQVSSYDNQLIKEFSDGEKEEEEEKKKEKEEERRGRGEG